MEGVREGEVRNFWSQYIQSLHQTIEKVSGVVSGNSDNGYSGQTAHPLPIY